MSQQARERTLAGFRSGEVSCLIATDVAARGLDIPEVDVVVHYEFPTQMDAYVHRCGRTGRAGRSGTSVMFTKPNENRNTERIKVY